MPLSPHLIALPVTAVTCLEDRAHIERTTGLDLAAGVHKLRLGPVSPLAVDRSLHAEVTADHPVSVLDVRITRAWTPRAPGPSDDDSALRRRVHTLEAEQLALRQRCERLDARRDLLGRLTADVLREIGEGAGAGEADPARWARELDRADAERDACAERARTARAELAAVHAALDQVRRALRLAEDEPLEPTAHIELTVESAEAGAARLRLSHLTACALWRPAYRAVLDGDQLTLETDAMVWQRTGEDWSDVRLTLSTARSAAATEPPRLHEDRLTLTDRTAAERRTVDVELREEESASLGPAATPGLPGVDDGGETRVLRPAAPVTVPGDGRAHRVPVSAFTAPAHLELRCAPEMSPVVTRVARCDNTSGHTLLAGPVDLVLGGGYAGRAALDLTAAGAPVELSFGSRDDYHVARDTEETRASAGLGQRTVITRTVTVRLSRFSAPGEDDERRVAVRERVPVSEHAAVRTRIREDACLPPPASVDAEGIARWDVALPPGGHRTLTLVHEITADAKVTGL
ncbi:mucoidy inhibitor MuiA family protein [Streptomyces sp. ODS05-4]|uniref:mucoidy inhibitor MuiA family protein n=1 Tax=Streptomyces sp. ODS05-4 TaxID=2944939 RepID=UPI00210B6727|nr:mucoidy inhibitor MuiA family protein [Streptomyces sp. ODS05-4]